MQNRKHDPTWYLKLKESERLEKAIALLKAYKNGSRPKGHMTFYANGKGKGVWYPDPSETCECCRSISPPSYKYPWSYYRHCFAVCHVANVFRIKESVLRRAYVSDIVLEALTTGKEEIISRSGYRVRSPRRLNVRSASYGGVIASKPKKKR